jgi:hypothetical protein
VNEGNAMNLTSGIFTAPGIYFFSFTEKVNFPVSSTHLYLGVRLYYNGDLIGLGNVQEDETKTVKFCAHPVDAELE